MEYNKEIMNENISWSSLNIDINEAATRGCQIKDLLKIQDGTPITAGQLMNLKDHLERISKQYNGMQAFLNSITDFEGAAIWLSRNSYSLSAGRNLLGIIKHPKGKKGL